MEGRSMNCGIKTRHYCGRNSTCPTNVPETTDSELFCNIPHPKLVFNENLNREVPIAQCRRQPHTAGLHSAYTFGPNIPEEWGDE
jgi:hypothetical protein